jgi:hypothetical protein
MAAAAAGHKVRIKDLIRQVMPCTPLTGDLGKTDLAVLERYADPRELLRLGRDGLTALIVRESKNHQGAARAEQWPAAARAAVGLYGEHPAVAFTDLATETATEVRLLRAIDVELAAHAVERESCYRWVDPMQLARSLPGLAEVGGPAMTSVIGDAARFPTAAHFKSYLGLVPRASETGDTDRKGHLKASCVVAGRLAERLWTVMRRRMPYVICDVDGTTVTPQQAKQIIAEQWTVTGEIRRRRRSNKKSRAGKAPQQVLTGRDQRDARSVRTRRPSPHESFSARSQTVKPTHT